MIELKDVTYQVGHQTILDLVNLKIEKGERIALIGPSGAGKSSLLNLLSKRIAPSSGHIFLEGQSLKTLPKKDLSDCLGMISQSFDLIEAMTVRSNIYVGQFRHWSWFRTIHYMLGHSVNIDKILEAVGLAKMGDKHVKNLSGGEKQRVAIARLMMQEARVILADEPIASLDPALSASIIELLVKTAADKTLLVSLHQQDYAVQYFDRIIGLKEGKIFFDLPSKTVDQSHLDKLYERRT